jgi:1,4-alpha-glucan branching enzyme
MILDLIHPTEYQLHLYHEGNFFECYRLFGAHVLNQNDNKCTRFCVWAPNAKQVSLVSNLNNWNGSGYEFTKVNDEGIWMLIVEQDLTGYLYKYEILTSSGECLLKSDPYAFYSEERPQTASICYNLDGYKWMDHKWLQKKERNRVYASPTIIYEMHLGSWKKKADGSFFTYRELAEELIPYVLEHGFTHIELLPLVEHPLDISWGYQGTGYFSVTSRYGTPHDLMYFIDQCHQNNIGVIMDWVPGHFCKDAHGLHRFDGSWVYEYETEVDRENYTWGTANFNLCKTEVQSFLISNALFWMEYFHVDGFRVDAVSNIIYWPNSNEQRVNEFGIAFLKKLNQIVFQYDPHLLMIAEDSTDWPQVTSPTHYGGLGFNYKWNMGWMNDMLSYMGKSPHERSRFHDKVTFSLLYAFTENFMLPFSHDEVVHGKKSLLDKMPGDYWQKFAQLRLLLAYMFGHPGKKLLFMGFEFGQFSEWKDEEELDWHLLDYEMHEKTNHFVKELIKVYKRNKALYEFDHLQEGFEWIDVNNRDQSIFSFVRKGEEGDPLVVVCNFTEQTYEDYKVGVPKEGTYREIINTDASEFGGSGVINKKPLETIDEVFHGREHHIMMRIPPFGVSILRPVKHRKERKGNGKEEVRSYAVSRRTGK